MRSCWEPSLKASLIAFSSASACFLYPHPPHHWQLMTTLSFFASAIVWSGCEVLFEKEVFAEILNWFFAHPFYHCWTTVAASRSPLATVATSRSPRARQPRCSEASCRATRRSSPGLSPPRSRRMPGLPSRPSPCSRPAALSARRRPNAMLCGGPVATRPGAAVAVPRGAPLVLCGRRCWPSRPASKRSRHA